MANEYKEKAGEEPSFKNTSRTRSLKNLEKKEVVKMPSGFKMAKNITKSMIIFFIYR